MGARWRTTVPDAHAINPLVITLGEELTPGLARAVVRNWWPWLKVRSARAAFRSELFRKTVPLVLLQAGGDPFEVLQVIRFLRAPWRRTPVVVIEDTAGSACELTMRGEGVVCFLAASEVEPELVEDLVSSIVNRPGEQGRRSTRTARQPETGSTRHNPMGACL